MLPFSGGCTSQILSPKGRLQMSPVVWSATDDKGKCRNLGGYKKCASEKMWNLRNDLASNDLQNGSVGEAPSVELLQLLLRQRNCQCMVAEFQDSGHGHHLRGDFEGEFVHIRRLVDAEVHGIRAFIGHRTHRLPVIPLWSIDTVFPRAQTNYRKDT